MHVLRSLVLFGGIGALSTTVAQANPKLKVTDHFFCTADLVGKTAKDTVHKELIYDAERGSDQTDPHWVPGSTMTASQGGPMFELTPSIRLSMSLLYLTYTSESLRAGAQYTCLAYYFYNDHGPSTGFSCPTPALPDSPTYDPVTAMGLPQTPLDPNGVAVFRAQDLPAMGLAGLVGGEQWSQWRGNCAYLSTTETPL